MSGWKEGPAAFDNCVEASDSDSNNFMGLKKSSARQAWEKKTILSKFSHRNFFKDLSKSVSFRPAHLRSSVPDSSLNLLGGQALAFVAANGLEFQLDTLADIHPKIRIVGPE